MKTPFRTISFLAVCAAGLCFAGCSFLKPSGVNTRSFVLTPLPTPDSSAASMAITVGVGFVKLPSYLFNDSIAMRQGANEITYLDTARWAERLDTGLQRVLAANLAALLPTDRIRLSAWRPEDVTVEVYVAVEQFDVDSQGNGVLVAWWRILSPAGEKILKAGQFRAGHQGPAPNVDPQAATATMSALAADLSRELAQAIKSTAP